MWHRIKYIRISVFIIAIVLCTEQSYCSYNGGIERSVLLLIDCSGSMMGPKMDSVKSAARNLVRMLVPCNTEFAIMGFTGDKEKPVPYRLDFTCDIDKLTGFINRLNPWGGTRIGAALKTGSIYFKEHQQSIKTSNNTIILLSDGLSDDNISEALNDLKNQNALFKTECIGYDLSKDKDAEEQLKNISRYTGGEYYSASDVSNVGKAFYKTSIKTIIHEVPVVVRNVNKISEFKSGTSNVYKKLISQYWVLDSIQINASDSLYATALMITEENMQDTMPKSLVFDNSSKVSLFINKGSGANGYQKWVEGNYVFSNNSLTINVLQYYFKLIIKYIDSRSLQLCVNKYAALPEDKSDSEGIICDCSNKLSNDKPYILVYFSKAGCN